ncbi:tRNA (mnm(5)s(2)U34)-methyltransferase [Cellulosilyticum sp. I15G10I2]|uniref:tRNA (mnm(5)s(2)U34)-methyltransferase n=1 Tax=Cellulosilyticum sp. I15G10I2 TaxID=1892843 RepID=UPI00085C42BE|nr:class I SAM-dependent methyltransferase [Cellulosilyticum sp. I15G10I2]
MFERNMTSNAHQIIRSHLKGLNKNNLVAVDGTVGNGLDLAFLMQLETVERVIGFDIQQEAINTGNNLAGECNKHVELILDSHHHIDKYIDKINIAMFNLGYLPKGDKKIVTRCETSMLAIEKTIERLADGGILTIMTYQGHDEGNKEYQKIDTYLSNFYDRSVNVFNLSLKNTYKSCPNLYVVIKNCHS